MSTINIRDIQHYLYCPRRFGLLKLNDDWAENVFVIKANLMHERVHSRAHGFSTSSKSAFSSVAVYNDKPELDLYGFVDCIEFEKFLSGTYIPELEGKYKVKVIEYKPKRPASRKVNQADAIQVFAQKICVDYVWKCNCEAYIYYSDVRRRVKLPFDTEFDNYYNLLQDLLTKMRMCLHNRIIPAKQKKQKCYGCSLIDICMPKDTKVDIHKTILSSLKE